jgi:hypothetical protein
MPIEITMVETADVIAQKIAPVLILDTCAILDLVRLPVRTSDPARLKSVLMAIQKILRLAKLNPLAIYMVIPPLVRDEWRDNISTVSSELKAHFEKLNRMIETANVTNDCILKAGRVSPISGIQLHDKLLEICKGIFGYAIQLKPEEKTTLRASDRASRYIPPASKGAIKDCIIYEHALALISKLRERGILTKTVFLTSNINDFCENSTGTTPREPIKSEMEKVSFVMTTNWPWALHELGF